MHVLVKYYKNVFGGNWYWWKRDRYTFDENVSHLIEPHYLHK